MSGTAADNRAEDQVRTDQGPGAFDFDMEFLHSLIERSRTELEADLSRHGGLVLQLEEFERALRRSGVDGAQLKAVKSAFPTRLGAPLFRGREPEGVWEPSPAQVRTARSLRLEATQLLLVYLENHTTDLERWQARRWQAEGRAGTDARGDEK